MNVLEYYVRSMSCIEATFGTLVGLDSMASITCRRSL